jgi:hypothetical protein
VCLQGEKGDAALTTGFQRIRPHFLVLYDGSSTDYIVVHEESSKILQAILFHGVDYALLLGNMEDEVLLAARFTNTDSQRLGATIRGFSASQGDERSSAIRSGSFWGPEISR